MVNLEKNAKASYSACRKQLAKKKKFDNDDDDATIKVSNISCQSACSW